MLAQMARDVGEALFEVTGNLRAVRLEPFEISDRKTSLPDDTTEPKQKSPNNILQAVPPMQAPANLQQFVGRQEYIDDVLAYIESVRAPHVICFVGMGGIGKTTLATHVAYILRERYHDGILWARISASDIMTTLLGFAMAYGIDVGNLRDVSTRGAAVRSILVNKKAIVILDDVENVDEITPFVTSVGEGLFIITTRRSDIGFAHGYHVVSINRLSQHEAIELLSLLIGTERVKRQHPDAVELVEILGYLPLAIRLVAGYLVGASDLLLREYIDLLRNEGDNIDGDFIEYTGLNYVYNTTYQQLSDHSRSIFLRLSIFSGQDFSISAVCAAVDFPENLAKFSMGELVNRSMVYVEAGNRYSVHPVLQTFARKHLEEDVEIRARESLSQYYLQLLKDNNHLESFNHLDKDYIDILETTKWNYSTGRQKTFLDFMQLLAGDYPQNYLYVRGHWNEAKDTLAKAIEVSRSLAEIDLERRFLRNLGEINIDQGDYFDAETLITTSFRMASEKNDKPGILESLSALARLSLLKSDYEKAIELSEKAIRIIDDIDDKSGSGDINYQLGNIYFEKGDYDKARSCYMYSLGIYEESGEILRIASVLHELGRISASQDNYDLAQEYFERSISINEVNGNKASLAPTLHRMGMLSMNKGDISKALVYYKRCLEINQELNDKRGIAIATQALGGIAYRQRNFNEAESYFISSQKINRELGDKRGLASNLKNLGDVAVSREQYSNALEYYLESLGINEEIQNMVGMAMSAKAVGDVVSLMSDYDKAREYYERSLELNERAGNIHGKAYVLNALGDLLEKQGDVTMAVSYWRQSLEIFQHLGSFMVSRVKRKVDHFGKE